MNARQVVCVVLCVVLSAMASARADHPANAAALPGTELLTIQEPLDEVMVDGIRRFAERAIEESVDQRAAKWQRDYTSPEAYEKSIAANRERFRTIIGAVDERNSEIQGDVPLDVFGFTNTQSVFTSDNVLAQRVRVRVFDGVSADGWLVTSNDATTEIRACVVALPDADWTPEMFIGLKDGMPAQSQIPRRLARSGCLVFVPTLISRGDEFSGNPDVAFTNQPHREFIYRMAFQMGRHIIGYEVQKVLAAIDVFEQYEKNRGEQGRDVPIGVVGVGEGGLIALYSAALDPRIDAAMVCGYFQPREKVWQEPIYRNVFSLLTEFGDAEIASLIAPRPLVIEACAVPEVDGPPAVRDGRRGGAAPGKIETATLGEVRSEIDRAMAHYEKLGAAEKLTLVSSGEGDGPAGTDSALSAFLSSLRFKDALKPGGEPPKPSGELPDAAERQKRQVDELVEFTQKLYRRSARVRDEFWSKADRSSVDAWVESTEFYRNYIWEEMIGKLPEPTMPQNVRTRRVLDDPAYSGYEVVIDVYPDVIAAGILLLPMDLKGAEERPVVVCQHGLEGTPMSTIDAEGPSYNYYKGFAVELAKQGFITYAPQNPYRGADRFRVLQRMSNPMKRSLFSYIIRQHERTLQWLSSLPNVDPQRMGFYGLSYGGKTAVRVPPILNQYALSICSADYNEWILKNVSNADRYSYMFTPEYEMYEWNMGHVANYSELASLMAPRPFMVERGHDDGVAPDEWVAWEYAKVRRHYAKLGIGDRTEIEFFDGPHSIHGVGTYKFLHRQLDWPQGD